MQRIRTVLDVLYRTQILEIYKDFYIREPWIHIHDESVYSAAVECIKDNCLDIFLGGQQNSFVLTAGQNNLMKGSAGNTVQCISLMLGFEECTGLI